MRSKWTVGSFLICLVVMMGSSSSFADEVTAKNAKTWEFTGRVQMQHLYDTDLDAGATRTNNGFRMRRVRIQTKVKMNDWISGKIQVDVRDNNPTLKDAEGKITLFGKGYLRFGQFKVPVWREEFKRSSGKLLLVERSEAAEFLADGLLSARHVGVEIGGDLSDHFSFAINYSNGAGEGIREDAGRSKSTEVNNGKMMVARIDAKVAKGLEVGISGVVNNLGNKIDIAEMTDNTGAVTLIAPDLGIYLKDAGVDIEAGVGFGSIDKALLGGSDDRSFTVADLTGRWMTKLASESADLGGLDAVGLGGGISRIDPNGDVEDDEAIFLRFGPEFYFGKNTRLQVNGELEMPAAQDVDNTFKIRSQLTLNL